MELIRDQTSNNNYILANKTINIMVKNIKMKKRLEDLCEIIISQSQL